MIGNALVSHYIIYLPYADMSYIILLLVPPGNVCPLDHQCDSTNGRCSLVNGIEVCTCISGYELQSDGITCSGMFLLSFTCHCFFH